MQFDNTVLVPFTLLHLGTRIDARAMFEKKKVKHRGEEDMIIFTDFALGNEEMRIKDRHGTS